MTVTTTTKSPHWSIRGDSRREGRKIRCNTFSNGHTWRMIHNNVSAWGTARLDPRIPSRPRCPRQNESKCCQGQNDTKISDRKDSLQLRSNEEKIANCKLMTGWLWVSLTCQWFSREQRTLDLVVLLTLKCLADWHSAESAKNKHQFLQQPSNFVSPSRSCSRTHGLYFNPIDFAPEYLPSLINESLLSPGRRCLHMWPMNGGLMETNIPLEQESQQRRRPSCSVNVNHLTLCTFSPQQPSQGPSAARKTTIAAPTVRTMTTLVNASAAQASCVIGRVDICDWEHASHQYRLGKAFKVVLLYHRGLIIFNFWRWIPRLIGFQLWNPSGTIRYCFSRRVGKLGKNIDTLKYRDI